jgi:hypothetical protein
VPKPMSPNNRDFLYYFNGFLVVKKKYVFLRKTNKLKKSYDECMEDEDGRTSNRKRRD